MRQLALLVAFASAGVKLHAQTPRTAIEVDGTLNSGSGAAVASAGGVAVTLFKDASTEDLYLVRSTDGGLSFSSPLQIDLTGGMKRLQADSVHLVGSDAYCGWTVETGASGEEDFAFCIVDLSGAAPVVSSPEVLVAPSGLGFAAGQVRDYEFEACASPVAGVNVAFVSNFDPGALDGPDQAIVVAAPASGAFLAPLPLSGGAPSDCDEVALACEGDDLVVVWAENGGGGNDVALMRVNSMGGAAAAWIGPVMVNGSLLDDVEEDLDVDVAGGRIFVAWLHEILGVGGDEAYGRVFTTAGIAVTAETPLHSGLGTGDGDEIACVLSASGNPVAFFDYDTSGPDTIFASTSTDGGATFGEIAVSADEGAFVEAVAGSDGVVAATWTGFPTALPGVDAVETTYSCDDGVTWITLDGNTTSVDTDFASLDYDRSKRSVVLAYNAGPAVVNDRHVGGFSVCTLASAAFRNGGTNPASFVVTDTPDLGGSLDFEADLTTTGHLSAYFFAFDTPVSLALGAGQTLLCFDLGGNGELLTGAGIGPVAGPVAMVSVPVPNWPCLNGNPLCIQALHAFGVAPFALSNAQDCVLGATD